MDEILTGPSVGYTERDLLLRGAADVELLGRDVRVVWGVFSGRVGTIIHIGHDDGQPHSLLLRFADGTQGEALAGHVELVSS